LRAVLIRIAQKPPSRISSRASPVAPIDYGHRRDSLMPNCVRPLNLTESLTAARYRRSVSINAVSAAGCWRRLG